jgi:cyclomaltodextrin glucanotransferase
VVGDCPELGNWKISEAKTLEYINSKTWFGEIAFDESAGQPVSYKYVVLKGSARWDQPQRENRRPRKRILPERSVTKWRDIWEE